MIAMDQNTQTPPGSRPSSSSAKRRRSPMSIDLSDLPPLSQPSSPSNTLLITNLKDSAIFAPATLDHIRNLINSHSTAGIYSFSPLRGLSRIVVTFPDVDSAINIRTVLDGESLFNHRIRVYFGEPTPIDQEQRRLQPPSAGKQFFISPPPSPPHGWQSKEEDPPNKDAHAEDLVAALEKLSAQKEKDVSPVSPVPSRLDRRSRSSTLVFDPEEQGHSPDLPAIAVEDTTMADSPEALESDLDEEARRRLIVHTARPPVELMD